VTVVELADRLRAVGYEPRRPELLALAGALARPAGAAGARALLLEGPPGAGKSALAEAAARVLGAPLVVGQLHAWSDADELFVGVDVAAAVAGDAAAVRQDGVLAVAARSSQEHPMTVLLLDEVDKTPERAEALLLDWLQSGRVPVAPGRHLVTRHERLLVVLTSNGQRPLGDALLRRCRRVVMAPLPADQQAGLVAARARCALGVARLLVRLAHEVGEATGAVISLQEITHAAAELVVARDLADAREILAGWLARDEAGRAVVRRSQRAAAVWGEYVASTREGR